MRRIMHVDMDAFFAAVEQQRHPELRGRPLIVGGSGDPSARGVVSAASYEARRYGVHSSMPLRIAYRHCPEAVFLPVDHSTYAAVSKKIKGILHDFSPSVEEAGIDEAFLDVSHVEQTAEKLAATIKQRIRRETGLTCSIGIAPNKLLAKIGSGMNKPDGLTVILEGDIPSRVWPLPVRKLWGVGPKTESRLAQLGVQTIGELAALSRDALVGHFGEAKGEYLHRAARGIDDSLLAAEWEPKSLSRETTFQVDVASWETLASTLTHLTQDVVRRLRAKKYRAKTVTVKLRYFDFDTHTHGTTLAAPADDEDTILDATMHCLQRFAHAKRVRLVGIRVGGLERT